MRSIGAAALPLNACVRRGRVSSGFVGYLEARVSQDYSTSSELGTSRLERLVGNYILLRLETE